MLERLPLALKMRSLTHNQEVPCRLRAPHPAWTGRPVLTASEEMTPGTKSISLGKPRCLHSAPSPERLHPRPQHPALGVRL